MSRLPNTKKRTVVGSLIWATLAVAAGSAQAVTPFQQDVATAIDRGLSWFAAQGAYNVNGCTTDDAAGLAMEALLEKRPSGNPGDPPQGYSGASVGDKQFLRNIAACIINQTNANGNNFYAYRDGSRLFGLASYALTSGPDKSVLGTTITIKEAMDKLVDRTLAAQRKAPQFPAPADQGYWCYTDYWCEDSSTTQFAAAGLYAAKSFYASNKTGDGAMPFADAARLAAVNAALALAKRGYELNGAKYSDYGSCYELSATERGHGYNVGYNPSLQQTASGIYIQLFGGADVNSADVQNYMEWVRNRYRYSTLGSMGNGWESYSWSYYLWSSFKGMELIRQSGISPAPGKIGPNDYGLLAAAAAPACNQRQVSKDPLALARVASFGAGGVGFYSAEAKSQYFDFAHQLLSLQCANGSFTCNGSPSYWDTWAHNAYALLVLQRATGVVIQRCDVDGNGVVDRNDIAGVRAAIGTTPGANDVRDYDSNGKITIIDVRACTAKCTYSNCLPTPAGV